MTNKIESAILTPQMLLYVLAYKILHKPISYRLGELSIRTSSERTARERAFILLFPLIVFGGIGLLFATVWVSTFVNAGFEAEPLAYVRLAPLWHQLMWWGTLLCIAYASLSVYKVPLALRLLFSKQGQQPPNNRYEYQNHRTPQQRRG